VSRVESYRQILLTLPDWDPYLLSESGLPGPRGNLELAAAVADLADEGTLKRYASLDSAAAPANSPGEFLAFCGVLGLGRLVSEGRHEYLAWIRRAAGDRRWRLREAAAMALQRWGDTDMAALLGMAEEWCSGSYLEQRAAAAALCEPRLLQEAAITRRVLAVLDQITYSLSQAADRRDDGFRTLRQGLAYCWSVAVAALPSEGKAAMERWLRSEDRDVLWIMHENLKKRRLVRMDASWVREWSERRRALPAVGGTRHGQRAR